jgi:hypothetical protein
MRVIYAAEPVDDSAPLKSVPDHEIIEAKWCAQPLRSSNLIPFPFLSHTLHSYPDRSRVTPEELAGLPLRAKGNQQTTPLPQLACAKLIHQRRGQDPFQLGEGWHTSLPRVPDRVRGTPHKPSAHVVMRALTCTTG